MPGAIHVLLPDELLPPVPACGNCCCMQSRLHPLHGVQHELHELFDCDLPRHVLVQAAENDAQVGFGIRELEHLSTHGHELLEAHLPGAVLVLLPEELGPIPAPRCVGGSFQPRPCHSHHLRKIFLPGLLPLQPLRQLHCGCLSPQAPPADGILVYCLGVLYQPLHICQADRATRTLVQDRKEFPDCVAVSGPAALAFEA
mmetsp:Transcript_54748/g.138273  ORF Transcript_54748/g.138273 Transcript_54748/m.138273 type:complete len:200 (-) Transcript_54748:71-670(-)